MEYGLTSAQTLFLSLGVSLAMGTVLALVYLFGRRCLQFFWSLRDTRRHRSQGVE